MPTEPVVAGQRFVRRSSKSEGGTVIRRLDCIMYVAED